MSQGLTKKLPQTDTDRILAAIKNLETYVHASIDKLVTWLRSIDSRVRSLEEKVEQRLYDTRPMWQKVVTDISQLQTAISQLQAGQDAMRGDLRQVNDRLHRLKINHN